MMITCLSEDSKEKLKSLLMLWEGVRLFPYKDMNGHLTIGVGRNLDAKGLSHSEMQFLLQNDINESIAGLQNNIEYFNNLDDVRKIALITMAFNLGIHGVLEFREMLKFLEVKQYQNAAKAVLDSKLAKELPQRYERVAYLIEFGKLS